MATNQGDSPIAAALAVEFSELPSEICTKFANAIREEIAQALIGETSKGTLVIRVKVKAAPNLGGVLMKARRDAQLSQREVGNALGWAAVRVSRAEAGAPINADILSIMLNLYGITNPERIEALTQMAEDDRRKRRARSQAKRRRTLAQNS